MRATNSGGGVIGSIGQRIIRSKVVVVAVVVVPSNSRGRSRFVGIIGHYYNIATTIAVQRPFGVV